MIPDQAPHCEQSGEGALRLPALRGDELPLAAVLHLPGDGPLLFRNAESEEGHAQLGELFKLREARRHHETEVYPHIVGHGPVVVLPFPQSGHQELKPPCRSLLHGESSLSLHPRWRMQQPVD